MILFAVELFANGVKCFGFYIKSSLRQCKYLMLYFLNYIQIWNETKTWENSYHSMTVYRIHISLVLDKSTQNAYIGIFQKKKIKISLT